MLRTTRRLEHEWVEYDEKHRACTRCGLRLFCGTYGWVLLDWRGVPTHTNLLGDVSNSFGVCTLPPDPPIEETVIIEYTGDPDRYAGCERFMHRLPFSHRQNPGALVALASVVPVCGWKCTYWELGPARHWHGWTWCSDCWDGRGEKRQGFVPSSGELVARPRPQRVDPLALPGPMKKR